jgi:hypothetical protein
MPLNGSGALMGAAILLAIGNLDPAAVPAFATLGDTIALWVPTNVQCQPGTMTSAGAAVSGFGTLSVEGEAADLGVLLATAMQDPSADGIETWTKFATALLSHLETYGQVNGSTFAAPTPTGGPLTGTGLIQFTSVVFTPLLSSQLDVAEPLAAAMLEVFGAQILAHIALNASVIPLTTFLPFVPYTAAPGGGPITGAGAIT